MVKSELRSRARCESSRRRQGCAARPVPDVPPPTTIPQHRHHRGSTAWSHPSNLVWTPSRMAARSNSRPQQSQWSNWSVWLEAVADLGVDSPNRGSRTARGASARPHSRSMDAASTQPARSRDSAGRSSTLSFKTAIAGCAIWMISDLLLSHLPHQQTSFPTSFSLSPPRWFSTPTPTSLPSALVLRSSRRSTMAPVCLPRCLPSLLANSRQC